jgi:hypothetical protein
LAKRKAAGADSSNLRPIPSPHWTFSLKLLREAPNGETLTHKHEYETTQDDSEIRQVLAEAAKSFIATIEFYKTNLEAGNLMMLLLRKH